MNDSLTGDGTLSSSGGAGSIIYEPQPIRDWPVGGIGDFHAVRGGINPGDISVFVPGLSELYICDDSGNGPYRPQMTVTFMDDLRPMSDKQSDKKAIPGISCLCFRLKLDRA